MDMFLFHFRTKDSDTHAMCTCGRHRMVTETSKTTNFQAHFFYNTFLYWLANLLIDKAFCIGKFFQAGERNQRNKQP